MAAGEPFRVVSSASKMSIKRMISLKVDNLPYRATADSLNEVFAKYGEIGDVYIPRDYETAESRGFAFVRFYDVLAPVPCRAARSASTVAVACLGAAVAPVAAVGVPPVLAGRSAAVVAGAAVDALPDVIAIVSDPSARKGDDDLLGKGAEESISDADPLVVGPLRPLPRPLIRPFLRLTRKTASRIPGAS